MAITIQNLFRWLDSRKSTPEKQQIEALKTVMMNRPDYKKTYKIVEYTNALGEGMCHLYSRNMEDASPNEFVKIISDWHYVGLFNTKKEALNKIELLKQAQKTRKLKTMVRAKEEFYD